jgi:hypothetical protein
MPRQVKHRRGSTSEIQTFTPAIGELVMDTDKKRLILGDGVTQGGVSVADATFNTVADMVATSHTVGDKVTTAGFYVSGDGGGADYVIYSGQTSDGYGRIDVGNGLTAFIVVVGKVADVKQFGAYGTNTGEDDTAAIQYALDNYGATFLPEGWYNVTTLRVAASSTFYSTTARARLRQISGTTTGCVILAQVFTEIKNFTILGQSSAQAIEVTGFRATLDNIIVEGSPIRCLHVYGGGSEVIVKYGKYNGATGDGIKVEAFDAYFINVYVEGAGGNGIVILNTGGAVMVHVHSYNNANHGVYIAGADNCQLSHVYSDGSGRNGFEIVNLQSASMSFIDCWAFNSGQASSSWNWFFSNARGVRVIGGSSNDGNLNQDIRVHSNSEVNFIGHHANSFAKSAGSILRSTCSTGLLAENDKPQGTYYGGLINLATPGSVGTFTIHTAIPFSMPGYSSRNFKIDISYRNTQGVNNAQIGLDQHLCVYNLNYGGGGKFKLIGNVGAAGQQGTLGSMTMTESTYVPGMAVFTIQLTGTQDAGWVSTDFTLMLTYLNSLYDT